MKKLKSGWETLKRNLKRDKDNHPPISVVINDPPPDMPVVDTTAPPQEDIPVFPGGQPIPPDVPPAVPPVPQNTEPFPQLTEQPVEPPRMVPRDERFVPLATQPEQHPQQAEGSQESGSSSDLIDVSPDRSADFAVPEDVLTLPPRDLPSHVASTAEPQVSFGCIFVDAMVVT